MLKIEWKSCGRSNAPSRGSVVSVAGVSSGVAWVYDDRDVFVIPTQGNVAEPHDMRRVDRRSVQVIGFLTDQCLADLREAMVNAHALNSAPSNGWEDAVADDTDTEISLPGRNDGWEPMSETDGTYWRFPRHYSANDC